MEADLTRAEQTKFDTLFWSIKAFCGQRKSSLGRDNPSLNVFSPSVRTKSLLFRSPLSCLLQLKIVYFSSPITTATLLSSLPALAVSAVSAASAASHSSQSSSFVALRALRGEGKKTKRERRVNIRNSRASLNQTCSHRAGGRATYIETRTGKLCRPKAKATAAMAALTWSSVTVNVYVRSELAP